MKIMRRMALLVGLGVPGLIVAAACAAGPAGEGASPSPDRVPVAEGPAAQEAVMGQHPDVDFDVSCVECHERVTPRSVEGWRESIHGQTNVGCFVCHGDAEEQLMIRPPVSVCLTCHDGRLDGYTAAGGHRFRFTER